MIMSLIITVSEKANRSDTVDFPIDLAGWASDTSTACSVRSLYFERRSPVDGHELGMLDVDVRYQSSCIDTQNSR